jgi:hypothetical protein
MESAPTLRAESVLERRLTRYLIAIGGVLTGVGACVLVATSDHLVDPLAYGLLLADVIIGTAAVAIYWIVRRPGSRMALILLVLAGAFVGISLQGAASPLLHSIGVLFDPVVFTLAYYAVFAFPNGRLVSPLDRLLIAAPLLAVFTSFLPWFLFSPYVSGSANRSPARSSPAPARSRRGHLGLADPLRSRRRGLLRRVKRTLGRHRVPQRLDDVDATRRSDVGRSRPA